MDCQSLALALQDLSTSIQEIASTDHHPPSNFVLHRTQCLCLAKSYALAVQHVIQQLDSTCLDSGTHQDLLPSLSELHHAMLQGREFLCDCLLQDGWVKKALVLALSTEAQDVCLHDLVWCLCVIHQAMGQHLALQDDEPEDNIYGTLDGIWAAASHEEDMHVLLDALKRQIEGWKLQLLDATSSGEGINAQCCLAEFLLRRLSIETENASAPWPLDALPHYLRVDPLEITIKKAAIARGAFAVFNKVEWHGVTFGQKQFCEIDETLFATEAAIQARLRHPNLLQLVCCTYSVPSDDQYGLLLQLMDTNLRKLIEDRQKSGFDRPFSLLTSVDLMLQIAMGMEHLHSLHIMHRDLKSANLLVTYKSPMDESLTDCWMRLKIADFGASKAKNETSRYTTLRRGTTNWMAPELFEVNAENGSEDQATIKYTNKADVYSFAMVCFEILSGNIPFDDGGKRSRLHQRLLQGERPKLPSCCPPYLASYIENCWDGDPEKRPSFDQISRAMRHLKGILLSSANPLTTSPALLTRGLSLIEDSLQRAVGVNWLSTAPKRITTKGMNISFEMSQYRSGMEGMLTKQKLEESSAMPEEDPLPGVEGLCIDGDAILGSKITVRGISINGTTLCHFQWVRHHPDDSFLNIPGAGAPEYTITADDVDTLLSVEFTPMDDRERRGKTIQVFVNNYNRIPVEPHMKDQIIKSLDNGQAIFEVKIVIETSQDTSLEPALLTLKRAIYELKRKNGKRIVGSGRYASESAWVEIKVGKDSQCAIISNTEVMHLLDCSDNRLRDLLVLTMREFIKAAIEQKRGKKRLWFI